MQGKIEINGAGLNYRIDGPEGAVGVVMGNSLATNYSMWDDQMEVLTAKYRVLRFDKRGHGGSDVGDAEVSLELLADDTVALADELGFTGGHYVGLSIGGMIGQAIGLNHPGAFRSLALCATSSRIEPDLHPMWEERIAMAREKGMAGMVEGTLGRWFSEPYREANPDKVAIVGEMVANTTVDGYENCCRAIMQLNYTDRLGGISLPTLVVPGEVDPALPPALSEVIHAHIPGSRLHVVSGAAHLCNVENPSEFNDVVIGFLDEHSG